VDVAPDWICEVLSPRGERRDRVVKAELYLRSGVHHYWILDIDGRTLEAFAAREGAWVRLGAWSDGDVSRIPPFEAIEFDVTDLFPPLASEGT
jgi:Uma2 family endonuclease